MKNFSKYRGKFQIKEMKEMLRKYRNFGNSPRKKKQDLNEIPKEIKTNSQKTRLNQDILRDQD